MARSGSGTWSPPAGQPVVAGTTISHTAHNDLVADIGTELSDSLSPSGKGSMLSAFKAVDGNVGGPGIAFSSETATGLYRAGAGDARFGILGALVQKWIAAGIEITGTIKASLGLADDASHGNRGGGALHADAVAGGASGFLTGADKTKLDDATAAATASKLVLRDANGRAAVADPSAASDVATKNYVDTTFSSAASATTATNGTDWNAAVNSVRKSAAVVSVFLNTAVSGGTAAWTSIATLPAGYRPAVNMYFVGTAYDSSATTYFAARFMISTAGVVSLDKYDNGAALVDMFAIGVNDAFVGSAHFVV